MPLRCSDRTIAPSFENQIGDDQPDNCYAYGALFKLWALNPRKQGFR